MPRSSSRHRARTNRSHLPIEVLKKYQGQWVAFSADGSRIVAGAEDLASLDQRVIAAGENPEEVGIERIEFEDTSVGGAELG